MRKSRASAGNLLRRGYVMEQCKSASARFFKTKKKRRTGDDMQEARSHPVISAEA